MAAAAAQPRRAMLVVVTAMATTVAVAGCGRGDGDPPPATPTSTATITASVDEVGAHAERDLPQTAQEYAEAAVAAWSAPDLMRLAELTTPEVHDEIIELPGPPSLGWTTIACDPQPGSSACAFHNADGDYLVLGVDHELLGEPHAVTEMQFEATTYPDDAQAYVEAFVAAWQDGNPPRMADLAVPDAAAVLRQLPPAPVVDYTVTDPGDATVTVVVVVLADAEVETRVSTGLLGEPGAIRQATLREQ